MLGRRKQQAILGVDIHAGQCHVVSLKGRGCHFACALSELDQHLNEHRLGNSEVAFSVSSGDAFTQLIDVPKSVEKKLLEQQLLFLAHDQCPYTLEDMAYDYCQVDEDEANLKFLFVAAKKSTVNTQAEQLSALGLQPMVADVSQFALMRTLESLKPDDKDYVLYDVQSDTMNVIVVQNTLPVFQQQVRLAAGVSLLDAQQRLAMFLQSSTAQTDNLPTYLTGLGDLKSLQGEVVSPDEFSPDYAKAYGLALAGGVS